MSRETPITRAPGGTAERTVQAGEITIPDLWHIAMRLRDQGQHLNSDAVLEAWHLCHDLLKHITGAEINPSPCPYCNGLRTVPNTVDASSGARMACPACTEEG
jgi:hypothetical protein